MGYTIRETPLTEGTLVEVVEAYTDESGQSRERLIERVGVARTKRTLDAYRDWAENWIQEHTPVTAENLIETAATELLRTYERAQHSRILSTDLGQSWSTNARLRVDAPTLVNSFFQQHGLDDLVGDPAHQTAQTLRDEVARQAVEIGRSDQDVESELSRGSYYHGRSRRLMQMLRRLTARRIQQLPSLLTEVATSTLGAPVTEAYLIFSTRQILFTETEVRDWHYEYYYGDGGDGRLRPQRVGLAVLVTPNGLPLDCWTLNGPVLTPKALRPILSKVRRRHSNLNVAVVGGDTLMKPDTLATIAQAGFGHVMAAELRELPPPLA